jgi:ubiquinone/menaquinone biosynthesis C-methylase UbiE
VHLRVAEFLACPVCRKSLVFEGKRAGNRFFSGFFKCGGGHVYQVKEEMGLFKGARLSANEFKWNVDVADEKRYDEIRKQYDSYLREDQRIAVGEMLSRLVRYVAGSRESSGGMVLDIASGMGAFLLQLADSCSRDALVIGTDMDERPLRGAMSKARKAGTYDRLSFIVADAKHLCFKDDGFLTISSHFGFDNVPKTVLAFKECARILRIDGRMFFSSLWLKKNSESMRLAEKHHVCEVASLTKLENALKKAGLVLNSVEEVYSGVWPHNPMDLLPVEGDEYKHVIVQAKKPAG